ncbi:MAG TPA: superoxide dismutase family protein [Bacillales bacterium]|nr:superoxide dismutase family protein [Bacillales bacterium]
MRIKMVAMLTVLCLGISACSGTEQDSANKNDGRQVKADPVAGDGAGKSLTVPLVNAKGKKSGEARLVQTSDGVKIHVQASGLKPGKHGIHIHEFGKCTPPDFKSAGEHFNPFGKQHGLANPKGPHAGDLPNLVVGKSGEVEASFTAKYVTLKQGKNNSLLDADGSALVIHADPDDNKSQPSGNSGARVLCGVIGK